MSLPITIWVFLILVLDHGLRCFFFLNKFAISNIPCFFRFKAHTCATLHLYKHTVLCMFCYECLEEQSHCISFVSSPARAYYYLAPPEQVRQCLQRLWLLKLVQTSSTFPCQASRLRLTMIICLIDHHTIS